jgi:hypothetical protein
MFAVEIFRPEQLSNLPHGVIVQQDAAQDGHFGFDILGGSLLDLVLSMVRRTVKVPAASDQPRWCKWSVAAQGVIGSRHLLSQRMRHRGFCPVSNHLDRIYQMFTADAQAFKSGAFV